VRERGLKLLRALHDDEQYERIVIVAHSLGTVLAYDLLHLLWQDVGPTRGNEPEGAALAALRKLDEHTREVEDAFEAAGIQEEDQIWSVEDAVAHRNLQWAAFDQLRQAKAVPESKGTGKKPGRPARPAGWKISDFISLGSPLANAQFLITEGKDDFQLMKSERVLPTAPPKPYEKGQGALYADRPAAGGPAPPPAMHHGAVFGVVRWTNIYDEFSQGLFVFGDIISGPVSGQQCFGDTIDDIDVAVVREGIAPRFFTHNNYWIDPDKAASKPALHISYLRYAVDLYRGIPRAEAKRPAPPTRARSFELEDWAKARSKRVEDARRGRTSGPTAAA
jgi:hypothetical protein